MAPGCAGGQAGDNGLIILMEDGCQGGCTEQTLGKTLAQGEHFYQTFLFAPTLAFSAILVRFDTFWYILAAI